MKDYCQENFIHNLISPQLGAKNIRQKASNSLNYYVQFILLNIFFDIKKDDNELYKKITGNSMKNIEIYKYLSPNHIIDVEANTKREALEEMIDVICTSPKISDKEKFSKKIFAREKLMSTGIGHGIAIPHIRDDSVSDFVIALGRKKEGLKFEAIDMEPVRLIFMIGGNKSQKQEYTSLLSQLTLRLKKKKFKNKLLTAHSPEEIYKEIKSKQ